MKTRENFRPEELRIRDASDQEQKRGREIFEKLKKLTIAKEPLSQHEKNFFCLCVKVSLKNDGSINDYPCCEDYIFKELYLTYCHDLTGASNYTKTSGRIILDVKNDEKIKDLDQLINLASEWEKVIEKNNHSGKLLQCISKETRELIKSLDSEFNERNIPFAKGAFLYKYKKWGILLYSKFVHLMIKEISEQSINHDLAFTLCNLRIEMDECTLAHILLRHYGEGAKRLNTQKSHFYGEFHPRNLHENFKNIISLIDASGILQANEILKLPFLYKGKSYLIWINEDTKQVKGKGNVKFYRLKTFYPVTDQDVLKDLQDNYIIIRINDNLSIYKKV